MLKRFRLLPGFLLPGEKLTINDEKLTEFLFSVKVEKALPFKKTIQFPVMVFH